MIDKVAILVVTYNPNLKHFIECLDTYVRQSNLIVIVDNSDISFFKKEIDNISKGFDNIKLLQLNENTGIAKAQNIGIKSVISMGYEYLIELDQDSSLPISYVLNMLESFSLLVAAEYPLAGVGPVAKLTDGNYRKGHSLEGSLIEIDKTLSSGFFTHKSIYEHVGYKNEKLFIDYVDWDWCWRAKTLGYKIFLNQKVEINHSLGEGYKNIFQFKIGVPSPIRHYYQYRNSLFLLKESYVPLNWKIERLFVNFLKFFIIFFLDRKRERLNYVFAGIQDFFAKRYGKYL